MNISQLQEAFQSFTRASKSIELYYEQLQKKIDFLAYELERKNLELKKALSELEKTKDFLEAVLYSIKDVVIVTNEDDQVIMINKSAEEYLNINYSNIKGKTFKELKLNLLEEGKDTFLISNGKRFVVIISDSSVIDKAGNVRGRVLLIRDISKLRELEIQNERNQRLIAMGEMAAKIVHEIRNPLCSIELYASMLQNEIMDLEQKRLALGISRSISTLNNILTNMSIFARPNKPVLKPIKLNIIITECIEMILPMLTSSKTKLKSSLLDSTIEGDGELLKQVFLNLMINAIQARREEERQDLLIEINMVEDEQYFIVEIKDNGIGIKEENLEKIFDPFFTTKESGTGLGLSISAMIIQSHGGFIKVFSEYGKGSSFSVFLKKSKFLS
ncbi:MAG: ATP-binding protein [Thermodesulfovibrionales bacterium]|nr:ATP-binding protein [Thermodesulfovibrionales bacterium]